MKNPHSFKSKIMKNFLYLFFLLPYFAMAQNQNIKPQDRPQPDYFINDQKVDWNNVYLNSDNIKNIKVVKEENGKIYLSLKENVFLTPLNEIKTDKKKSFYELYIVNGKIIKKPGDILIDPTEIAQMEIIKGKEIENLDKKMLIIKITTRSFLKEQQNKNQIHIRGA